MKKSLLLIVACIVAASAQAFDFTSLLGGGSQKSASTAETTDSVSANASSQGTSNPLGALGGLLGGGSNSGNGNGGSLGGILGGVVDNLTGSSEFKIEDIVGTWKYASPAVTLESDNVLQSLGGSAATSVIEQKLEPYYEKAGLNQLVLTVNPDHTFTMATKLATLKGVVENDPEQGLVFNFQALNKVTIGKVKTIASKSLTGLTITFDVSKLQKIVETVASLSQNQSMQSISSMLQSYKGVYAGFKLTKEN